MCRPGSPGALANILPKPKTLADVITRATHVSNDVVVIVKFDFVSITEVCEVSRPAYLFDMSCLLAYLKQTYDKNSTINLRQTISRCATCNGRAPYFLTYGFARGIGKLDENLIPERDLAENRSGAVAVVVNRSGAYGDRRSTRHYIVPAPADDLRCIQFRRHKAPARDQLLPCQITRSTDRQMRL